MPDRQEPLQLPTGRAICYSGYRDGQSPDAGTYPGKSQIREDLFMLRPHFQLLRIYDATPHAELVLEVIREERLPFRVLLGAWLAAEADSPACPWGGLHRPEELVANVAANEAEVARAIALASEYEDIVFALAIGNEAAVDWTDHFVPLDRLQSYLRQARNSVSQPVTTCDNYVPWGGRLRELAADVDFVSVHTYPLWEHKRVHEALAYTKENVLGVAEQWPGKPIVITEAGWATRANGRGFPPHHASEEAQDAYLRELLRWADDAGIICFVFEAFDEAWKGSSDPLEPEKHWGLYTSDRRPKRAMSMWPLD